MSNDFNAYSEGMKLPIWSLFYRVVGNQLSHIRNSRILDFGSGLGITANYLAKNNKVIAIEPNTELVKMRIRENSYEQVIGDIEQLRLQQDNSFDVVMCHNVLEYANDRKDIFKELSRVLKPNGILSVIKLNKAGKIAQLVIENNIDQAISLLDGRTSDATVFGKVNYYEIMDIKEWIGGMDIKVEKVLGIRTFWALEHDNEIRSDPTWQEKILEVEMKVSDLNDYVNVSFFNHVLLKKIS